MSLQIGICSTKQRVCHVVSSQRQEIQLFRPRKRAQRIKEQLILQPYRLKPFADTVRTEEALGKAKLPFTTPRTIWLTLIIFFSSTHRLKTISIQVSAMLPCGYNYTRQDRIKTKQTRPDSYSGFRVQVRFKSSFLRIYWLKVPKVQMDVHI
jgi:hypothetical protein